LATRTERRQTVKVDRFRIADNPGASQTNHFKTSRLPTVGGIFSEITWLVAADYLPFGTFCRSSCKEFCRNTAGPGVSVLRSGASEDREDYVVLRAQHKYRYNGGYPMITPHAHVSRSIGNQEMEAKPLLHSQPGLHVAAPGWNGKIRRGQRGSHAVEILDEAYRAAARPRVPDMFGTSWTEGLPYPRARCRGSHAGIRRWPRCLCRTCCLGRAKA
jgi:hypothetical protein